MEITNETFYGNENETFYVDQFGRIWLVQSVDFSESRNAELQTDLPTGLVEVDGSDLELSHNVFELTDEAKTEVIAQAKQDAELFVDEFNEQIDPKTTDWDAVGFGECRFSFHTNDPKTHDEAWELYQTTLVEETGRLTA